MQDNSITITSYEEHIQEYIDGTPQEVGGHVKEWIDRALDQLPKDAKILELGSAFGRDAAYIESKGFKVECTDATKGFVDLLQKQGHSARVLNAITDNFGGGYDMVIANAVLLHFTPQETVTVLHKIHRSLNDGGILAFTVKQGKGSEWSEAKLGAPRYFTYWTARDVDMLLADTGFTPVMVSPDNAGINNVQWLAVVARKSQT